MGQNKMGDPLSKMEPQKIKRDYQDFKTSVSVTPGLVSNVLMTFLTEVKEVQSSSA